MFKSKYTTPILLILTLTLPLLVFTSISTDCANYKVISNNNLSLSMINYISALIVEYCEVSTDYGSYCQGISGQLNSLYSCNCVNVFAAQVGSYSYLTSWEIYQGWNLVVESGNVETLIFVPSNCATFTEVELNKEIMAKYNVDSLTVRDNNQNQIYTSDQLKSFQKSGKINQLNFQKSINNLDQSVDRLSSVSDRVNGFLPITKDTVLAKECDCSSFIWYQTTLDAFYKSEIEKLAQYSCEVYPYYNSADYAFYLNEYIAEYFIYPNIIVGSLSNELGYEFYYEWYANFQVGCYATIVFAAPVTCTGYKNPTSIPTPTALISASPYYISSTPRPSNTPYPSISPSSSQSVGCGTPACSNHGHCNGNVCKCSSFYYGPQCQYEYCPGNCSFNGNCDGNTGECQCYYPYYGCDCSSILYNCSCEHGTCNQLNGLCTCDPGWTGTNCNVSVACADNCNNHGRCTINETCDCFFGWGGADCNTTDLNCTLGCYNGGYCNNITGTCSCPDPYFGPQCNWLHCGTGGTNESCSGHGKCNYQTGSCYCDVGFTGCFCTNWSGSGSPPPAKSPIALPTLLQCGTGGSDSICSGHGQCNHQTGSCYCDAGWHGCYCNQYTGTF